MLSHQASFIPLSTPSTKPSSFPSFPMDTKDLTTMNNNLRMDLHSDPFSSSSSPLGFMDLLGYQDYYSSIFDETTTTSYNHIPPMEIISTVDEESSVVLNGHPSSPNSSSISSPAAHQQCIKEKKTMGGDDEAKTKKKKKDKEPRFAFMTRTEMDHLDDGYRWRKYGQKAVKNSHFPRSYYRCTYASCNVKKRVERCMDDPSYVITTYEGKHNHPVIHNSAPLIPSFNHLTAAAAMAAGTPPGMIKLEQGGLLQDMLPCHH